MMRELIILGAGGHAKVLLDVANCIGLSVRGVIDPRFTGAEETWCGVPILGTEDATVWAYPPETVGLVNGIGSVGVPAGRRAVFEALKQGGYTFVTMIHPSAVVARDVVIGEGVQVMAGAVIQTGVRLSDNVIVNSRALVDHDCQIDGHTHIAPGACLSGGVSVGTTSHIGVGAVVIQGVRIGDHSVVGAGAVVLKDVAAHTVVAGVPATIKATAKLAEG